MGKKLALDEGAMGVDDEEDDDEAAVVDEDEQLVAVGRGGGGGCFILKAPLLPLLNSGSPLQYCKTSSS